MEWAEKGAGPAARAAPTEPAAANVVATAAMVTAALAGRRQAGGRGGLAGVSWTWAKPRVAVEEHRRGRGEEVDVIR